MVKRKRDEENQSGPINNNPSSVEPMMARRHRSRVRSERSREWSSLEGRRKKTLRQSKSPNLCRTKKLFSDYGKETAERKTRRAFVGEPAVGRCGVKVVTNATCRPRGRTIRGRFGSCRRRQWLHSEPPEKKLHSGMDTGTPKDERVVDWIQWHHFIQWRTGICTWGIMEEWVDLELATNPDIPSPSFFSQDSPVILGSVFSRFVSETAAEKIYSRAEP
ncbi:hypothetical protein C8J56DRAFT_932549 [Mycena floridula]|nr:hypothetical protein C8J56DRAFT_932549 [Mycena floridula]